MTRKARPKADVEVVAEVEPPPLPEYAQVDPRSFKIRRNGRASQMALARQQITRWAPNPQTCDSTLVTLDDGRAMQVSCPFREFHAWVISPALERDKRLKETLAAKKEVPKEKPKSRKTPANPRPRAPTQSERDHVSA